MYGLDIETDTELGGLDPAVAPIVAVAVVGADDSQVFRGSETDILYQLNEYLRDLPVGVIATWNGARFDLPFISDRAGLRCIDLGLKLEADHRTRIRRDPLPGHDGGYRARWFEHGHLDAYAVYRADVGASLGIPCGLKPLSQMMGFRPVEVDRGAIHELSDDELDDYVASDAYLTRELALRRWPTASLAIDKING